MQKNLAINLGIILAAFLLLIWAAGMGVFGPLFWRGNVRTLSEAVVHESVAEVKQRVLEGEPVNARDAKGRTPLENTIIFNRLDRREMMMLLLEHGADRLLPLGDGRTALDLVSRDEDRALLQSHAAKLKKALNDDTASD